MDILDKVVLSPTEPPWKTVLWIKPVQGGFAFYAWIDGKWRILRPMNDKGTSTPYDDQPYDLDGVGAKKLSDLEDVALDTLTDGQVLKYNGATWENGNDDVNPGPDSVGTEQIIDNSVIMDDLNDSVKEKIQKTYHQNDESLHMDYDIANANSGGFGEFNNPVEIEEGD